MSQEAPRGGDSGVQSGLVGERVGQRRLSEHPAHSCSRTVPPPVLKAVSGSGFLHVPSSESMLRTEINVSFLISKTEKGDFTALIIHPFFFLNLVMILNLTWVLFFKTQNKMPPGLKTKSALGGNRVTYAHSPLQRAYLGKGGIAHVQKAPGGSTGQIPSPVL